MKKVSYLPLLLLLLIAACSKKKQATAPTTPTGRYIDYNNFTTPIPDDGGCINRVWIDSMQITQSAGANDTAIALLKQNNLRYDNLFLFSVHYDTFGGSNNVSVSAYQYLSGLLCFNQSQGYLFKDGKIIYSNALSFSGSLDTIPSLKLSQLRTRFADCYKLWFNRSFSADSCLSAQFGSYNLNKPTDGTADIVRMWKVQPAHAALPYAYIKEDGTVVLFFTGAVY